jgi:hypothetical protein
VQQQGSRARASLAFFSLFLPSFLAPFTGIGEQMDVWGVIAGFGIGDAMLCNTRSPFLQAV